MCGIFIKLFSISLLSLLIAGCSVTENVVPQSEAKSTSRTSPAVQTPDDGQKPGVAASTSTAAQTGHSREQQTELTADGSELPIAQTYPLDPSDNPEELPIATTYPIEPSDNLDELPIAQTYPMEPSADETAADTESPSLSVAGVEAGSVNTAAPSQAGVIENTVATETAEPIVTATPPGSSMLGELPAGVPEADASTTVLTNTDNGGSVRMEANNPLQIRLSGNPTTGYTWSVKDFDPSVLSLTSHTYYADDSERVGTGGTFVFNFKALAPGATSVTLTYARPWESGQPADAFKTTVNVQ